MSSLEARYPIAAALAAGQREARLLHGPVRPCWSADSRWFWYATRGSGGTEHVLVDVGARSKRALFDAVALASALSGAVSKDVVPGDLPIERIDLDATPRHVSFVAFASRWHWDDDARRLDRIGEAFSSHELTSPDGQWGAFLDGPNLRVRRIDEPSSVALTNDGEANFGWGDFIDYTTYVQRRVAGTRARPHALWSPDSMRLAVVRVDRRSVKTMHIVQAVPPKGVRPVTYEYPFPMVPDSLAEREHAEIWILGLDGSRVRVDIDPLESFMHRAFIHGQGRWSEDGRHFDVVDNDRMTRSVSLWRANALDGSARRLIHEEGPGVMRPAPTLAMTPNYRVLADGRVIAWSQRDGWGHLYLVSPDGNWTAITQGAWQVRSLLHVDEDARRIVFTAGGREPGVDPYYCVPYTVAFDGSDLRCLAGEDLGDHEFVEAAYLGSGEPTRAHSVSPNGQLFVDVWSTILRPPSSVLRDAGTGAVVLPLESGDASRAWPQELPVPEAFCVPAIHGGLDLWGVLYRPAGFDSTKSYPVVEAIYAAPQTAVVPKAWAPGLHATIAEQLASIGCVAFIIDGPGTPFRSHAFQLASHGRMEICGNLPDHIAALRRLAATRPWMDLDRVGIVGGSGGGFATVRALATYPAFYKAGVALCGSHDSTAYIPYWGEMFQGAYEEGSYPNQDNNLVVKDLVGDLFLVQGELDDNVHPATTLRLVDSLIKADRDFDLLIVPNAGHMLPFNPYVVRRVLDFFVEKLVKNSSNLRRG